nr:retrovirus-related Pol polyprotein from transposon TNT 1-94 [Tanacetum cinerariifolium]
MRTNPLPRLGKGIYTPRGTAHVGYFEITKDGKVIGRGIRKKDLYVMKLGTKPKNQICLATIDDNSTLWHRRLGHANMHLIKSLTSKELVRNLPKIKFDQHLCDACKIRQKAHASHKAKNIVSTTRCLELLHMDLFSPSVVRSYGGNHYTLVIVDDYLDFEEKVLDAEVYENEAIPLSDEEIALDAASSEGSMSGLGSEGDEAADYGYDVYHDDY